MPSVSAHYRWTSLVTGTTITPAYQYVRQNTNYNSPVRIASWAIRMSVANIAHAPMPRSLMLLLTTYAATSVPKPQLPLPKPTPSQRVLSYIIFGPSASDLRISKYSIGWFGPRSGYLPPRRREQYVWDLLHISVRLIELFDSVYMAKAPGNASAFDGSGQVWFKVHQISTVTDGGSSITWPDNGLTQVTFTLPESLPNGQYLLRAEQIALHVRPSLLSLPLASGLMSCILWFRLRAPLAVHNFTFRAVRSTLRVVGSGTPGPLVPIPGVYTGYEPGILISMFALNVMNLSNDID
ncbi:hypothetical protein PHLCEN_2v11875 [Hermanssonia centrifuga]|uniref:lytic cellulose monooxygenase (C4-dehydrogenating) n=1 Tax=Hermanssonia centrifuga TaxID=98765 RepID=A0A2R6NIX0_9APHY|nr:hypothetical protein PHLCEN_2v11875 [Hermanssonia centrifuga]